MIFDRHKKAEHCKMWDKMKNVVQDRGGCKGSSDDLLDM